MTRSGLPSASTSQPTALEQLDDLGRRVGDAGDPGRLGRRRARSAAAGRGCRRRRRRRRPRAPPYSASSSAARASATTVISGSTPRSKRLAASLGSRCRRAVRATPVGSQCAASSSTFVVPSPISVDAPPMTAARPIGPVSSVISRSSACSFRVVPSSVVSFSPSRASRTMIGPGDGVAVEGVHRLAELEHHVVGDVDGQGDAADGGLRQPAAHPPRARRGRVEALHRDHREAVAARRGRRPRPARRGSPDQAGGVDRARVAPVGAPGRCPSRGRCRASTGSSRGRG